jgi:small subunit ribosomal protein S3
VGQKVHPLGFRLGHGKEWDSKWFAKRDYGDFFLEDIKIRKFVKDRLHRAGISKIGIERVANRAKINICTARPGIVIGTRGAEVERLKDELEEMTGKDISIDVQEIKKAELDAQLVAERVAIQLEKRFGFRRAMKKMVSSVMAVGAQGVKISCAGRLGGAEIARIEWYRQGRVPLHTIRADIDYGMAEAHTAYGVVGVKVWIFKKILLQREEKAAQIKESKETNEG